MKEYIIYVLLIFMPIGCTMAYFLRKDGLGKKNTAIILTLSLLIIITFPITVVRLGILVSFLIYILLIVIITRYLLGSQGELATQSKGTLVTGRELEKIMQTIDDNTDKDLSALRVEALEELEDDAALTALIEELPETAAIIEPAIVSEETKELKIAELPEEESKEIIIAMQKEEESDLILSEPVIDEAKLPETIIAAETDILAEEAGDDELSIDEMTVEDERTGEEAELAAVAEPAAVDTIRTIDTIDIDEEKIELLGAEEAEESAIIEKETAAIEAAAELEIDEESLISEMDSLGQEKELLDEQDEERIKPDEETELDHIESPAEEMPEGLAKADEAILDGDTTALPAIVTEAEATDTAMREEVALSTATHEEEPTITEIPDSMAVEEPFIADSTNAKIFDLIEQGFLHKEKGNLLKAVICFDQAWDLTMDDDLKRDLSIELLNIYQVIEEKQ